MLYIGKYWGRILAAFSFMWPQILTMNISATGGGIVKPGEDLVLAFSDGKVWDRCYWVFGNLNDGHETCSFDLDADTNKVTTHKCSSKETEKTMMYTGTDPKTCQITVKNVTDEYSGKWSASLDAGIAKNELEVIVARPIANVTVEAERLVADKPGQLTCTVFGGRPAPLLGWENALSPIVDHNQTQTPDDQGVFTTIETITIKPKIEDYGRVVGCKAFVQDENGKGLFEVVSAKQLKLDVQFGPQPVEDKSLSTNVGQNVTMEFEIRANPKPEVIEWIIEIPPRIPEGNKTESKRDITDDLVNDGEAAWQTVKFTPGHSDDKYVVPAIEQLENNKTVYRISMMIFGLEGRDGDKKYTLNVGNGILSRQYKVDVTVDADGNGTDDGDGQDDGSGENENGDNADNGDDKKTISKPLAIGITLFFTAIILLTAGVIFFLNKRKQKTQTAPMTTFESSGY